MFIAIRDRLDNEEKGFTLIELLVVVIIIGILAAIAIPTFLRQRERAWTADAVSAVRNAAVEMETYYTDAGNYADDAVMQPLFTSSGVASDEVTLEVVTPATTGQAYCIEAVHANIDSGGTVVAVYASADGGVATGSGVGC